MIIHGGSSAKSIDIMQMAMGAASKRSSVIMNNIANATTPNYKRQDITFQAQLERALRSEKEEANSAPMLTTDSRHIPLTRAQDYRSVKAKKITEFNTYQNNDGNSVDMDKEMLEHSKNTMYYNALAQRTAKEFNKLKFILRG